MPFTSAEAIAGKILPGVLAHWQGEEDFWSRRVLCLAACPTRVPADAAFPGQKCCVSPVLGPWCWHCSTGDKAGDSVSPHDNRPKQPGCAVSHQPPCRALCALFPAVPRQRVKGASVTSSFGMAELQITWKSLCPGAGNAQPCAADSCIPSSRWHVTLLSLSQAWQLPVNALRVSLQSPSSTSVFLVLLW